MEIKLSEVQKKKLDEISLEIQRHQIEINQLQQKQSDILEIILDSQGIDVTELEKGIELKEDCLVVETKKRKLKP